MQEFLEIHGLKCDTPTCDWRDDTIAFEDYEKYINHPCPKCGASVLTSEDYHLALTLLETFEKFKEQISDFESFSAGEENLKVKVHLGAHKEITVEGFEIIQ
jgi:hypothetical protein